jgi:hypothetical protein
LNLPRAIAHNDPRHTAQILAASDRLDKIEQRGLAFAAHDDVEAQSQRSLGIRRRVRPSRNPHDLLIERRQSLAEPA